MHTFCSRKQSLSLIYCEKNKCCEMSVFVSGKNNYQVGWWVVVVVARGGGGLDSKGALSATDWWGVGVVSVGY